MASVNCLRLASMACNCSAIWSKVRPTWLQAAAGRQTGATGEIPVADPAGGLFELLQAAPVGRSQSRMGRPRKGR